MPFGFYIIMAAQFFSSLADNALLVAAIALLVLSDSPAWMTPLLKFFFTVAYVVLAPFVGAFADALPKGHVMFISNLIKVAGCLLMLFGIDPLLAYGVVGVGAAFYSPAKYGILTELLPHERLVVANGWIEGLTVSSIILGTVLGGALISQTLSSRLLAFDIPQIDTHIDTAPEIAITIIVAFYVIAAAFNLWVPDTGVERRVPDRNPLAMVGEFAHCVKLLWTDKLGQISLAVTTLFWGAGATLQFIVLKWAETALGYTLSQATLLQGVCAIGIAIGSILAARFIPLNRATRVLPMGIAMGIVVMAMNFVTLLPVALVLMVLVGALAGFFVVPMNALLQHRGHILMGAGHSIAVQNFNENLSILAMLAIYALLISINLSIYSIIVLFGLFVAGTMYFVRRWYLANLARGPMPDLPGDRGH